MLIIFSKLLFLLCLRDDHGNGIPNENGNPVGIPWEWELMTKLGMVMGRNGKQPVWEWECPLFPWEYIPIGGCRVWFIFWLEKERYRFLRAKAARLL